jgi:predicted lipoprotein with Yx(FWY)xxD motif
VRIKSFVAAAVALGTLSIGVAAVAADARAHTAAAPTVSQRSTKLGTILINSKGLTLYLWAKDKNGKSVCSGACASVWPLLLISGKPTAGPGVQASKLGEYKTSNGKYEVTYNHHPLYTFVSDIKAGQTTGQGNTTFGGPWWVVSTAGNAITKKA